MIHTENNDNMVNLSNEEENMETLLHGRIIGNVISDGQSPNFFMQKFRLKTDANTHVGKIVAIQSFTPSGKDSLILARVTNVREQNPHEDALNATVRDVLPFETKYAPEGESTVIYRQADCEPIEEAVLDSTGNILEIIAPESLPKSGNPVFEASEDVIIQALGLEKDPDAGYNMGTIYGDESTSVILNKSVIQRHCLIVGGIGSGKSYTRGVLMEELCAMGIPQINIDVNGEMIESTDELGGLNIKPGQGFTLPLSALSSGDIINAIPAINRGTNIETLVSYAHESLLKYSNGNFFGVDQLVSEIDRIAPILKLEAKNTVEPAKIRAKSLERIEFLGQPFDWENNLKPGKIINIDCRGQLVSELRLITASIARDIQRLAKAKKIPFVVLSIDEFHLVAPNDDSSVTTQVLREVARIGRHYRMGLILTTQSPQDVDKSILKRLLTRFLHSIEADQLDSLKGVFSDASQELVKQLPKLPQGVCVLTGAFETVRHATVIKVRKRLSTHGGQTPDIFSDFADRGWKSKKSVVELMAKNNNQNESD